MLLPYNLGFRSEDRSGTEHVYLQPVLDALYHVRRYDYKLHEVPFSTEYPVYFRQHREFVLDNRRHGPITCEMYDSDPSGNDTSILAVTGTGLGVDYEGNWNTVSIRTQYGSFKGEKSKDGEYPTIVRKSVRDFPEHGKTI